MRKKNTNKKNVMKVNNEVGREVEADEEQEKWGRAIEQQKLNTKGKGKETEIVDWSAGEDENKEVRKGRWSNMNEL